MHPNVLFIQSPHSEACRIHPPPLRKSRLRGGRGLGPGRQDWVLQVAWPAPRALRAPLAPPFSLGWAPGARAHPGHVQLPGPLLARQTRRPGQLPRVGLAPDLWACRAAGKLIREATVALDGGKSQQPQHLHQHGPSVTWRGPGLGVHTPPSLSLLRSSSCRHRAPKMSGPARGHL